MFCNLLYWNIGRKFYQIRNTCSNPIDYLSKYCSYSFGSDFFHRENIRYMKRFYSYFPIYCKSFEKISWNHFKVILNIDSSKKRNFYLYLYLFLRCSTDELEQLIRMKSYERI
ncbi:MAG: hypothetical protein IJ193_01230 [Bacilli bacterium]|nr:hypothetical protein [Bacilli bacterium]